MKNTDPFVEPEFQQGQMMALVSAVKTILFYQPQNVQENTAETLRQMAALNEAESLKENSTVPRLVSDGFRQIADDIIEIFGGKE